MLTMYTEKATTMTTGERIFALSDIAATMKALDLS